LKSRPGFAQYTPYAAKDKAESDIKRNNFMALVLCLMMGTAALPHVLTRYYTTPSVTESRDSVFWSLFFIMLLYITIPSLAILVKYDIYNSLVGSEFSKLPSWVTYWANIDKLNPLVSITDINKDGIVQLAEIVLMAISSFSPRRKLLAYLTLFPVWSPLAGWRQHCQRQTDCC
jgi:cation/acetate symporter